MKTTPWEPPPTTNPTTTKRTRTWTAPRRNPESGEFCSRRRKPTSSKDDSASSDIYRLPSANNLRESSTWRRPKWKSGFKTIATSVRNRPSTKALCTTLRRRFLHHERFPCRCWCATVSPVMAVRRWRRVLGSRRTPRLRISVCVIHRSWELPISQPGSHTGRGKVAPRRNNHQGFEYSQQLLQQFVNSPFQSCCHTATKSTQSSYAKELNNWRITETFFVI